MPLQRFELKNEYGLGDPRLYIGALNKQEDPRVILEGVAVSGLVGILRQLGDLAEFASVVFHDVHQLVIVTAARGDKVLNRIRKIEEALPQFEKAVRESKSCIHFAYIAGCDWHANIKTSKSQLVGSDLPEFIMDSYEECHDPPRFHLLDRFDSAGDGACLKRYSDPSYFRRILANSESVKIEKTHNGMKVHRKKKQRPRRITRRSVFTTLPGRRGMDSLNSTVPLASLATDELSFSVDGTSISESLSKSDLINEFTFSELKKKGVGCIEVQEKPSISKEPYVPIPSKETEPNERLGCVLVNLDEGSAIDHLKHDSLHQQSAAFSSHIIRNDKIEMVKHGILMRANDASEGNLQDIKSAELLCEPSYQNYGVMDLVIQGDLVSMSPKCDENTTNDLEAWVKTESVSSSATSKENAADNFETRGKSWSSTSSLTRNEKAEIVESSSKLADDVVLNGLSDSDLFFLTLEAPKECCETVDTDTLIQDKTLGNFTEMTVPSWVGSQYSDLRSGLDKHMDATDAECQAGGVIVLPCQNYDRVEWDSVMQGFTTLCLDGADGKIDTGTENCSDDNDHCPEIINSNAQALVNDVILTEEFLCNASLEDTSAVINEKEVHLDHPPNSVLNSSFESTCHGMNIQSRKKNEIADSNLLCLITSRSSSDVYALPKLSDPVSSSSVDGANNSALSSHMDQDYIFLGSNDTQVPANISDISTSASENIPYTVPAATTVELQAIPVDTMRKSSINIWTNGGLLGLEPSKPSYISFGYGNNEMYDNISTANLQAEVLFNGDAPSKTSVEEDRLNHVACFAEQSECISEISDNKGCLHAPSFVSLHKGETALEVEVPKQKDCNTFSSSTDIPPNNELVSIGSSQNHIGISAGISSLTHRFLVNNLERNLSMSGITQLPNPVNNDVYELNGNSSHNKHVARSKQAMSSTSLYILENKENITSLGLTSPGFCSPPLEHIKLPCEPVNGSNYDKLKLELCGINLQGSKGDVLFPSFQLLNESPQPVVEDVSESEDDTFCRSFHYALDDLLSLYSESDADVWGDSERDASFRMVAANYDSDA